jgi:hypothetical protein
MANITDPGGGGNYDDGDDGSSDSGGGGDDRTIRETLEESAGGRIPDAEPDPDPEPAPEPDPSPSPDPTPESGTTDGGADASDTSPTTGGTDPQRKAQQAADALDDATTDPLEGAAATRDSSELVRDVIETQRDPQRTRTNASLRAAVAEQTSLDANEIQRVERTDDGVQPTLTRQARAERAVEQGGSAREQFRERRQTTRRLAGLSGVDREEAVPLSEFDMDDLRFEASGGSVTVRPTDAAARQQARQQAADEFGVDEEEVTVREIDDGGFRATVGSAGTGGQNGGAPARTREQAFLDRATGGLTETAREEGLTPEPGRQEDFIGGFLDDIGLTTPTEEEVTGDIQDRAADAAETAQDLNDQFSADGLGFGTSFEETGADVEEAAPAAIGFGAQAVETAGDLNDRFSVEGGVGDSAGATAEDVEQATPTDPEGAADTAQDLNDQFSADGLGFGDSFEETGADVEEQVPAAVDAAETAAGTVQDLNDQFSAGGLGFGDSFEETAEDAEQQAPAAIDAGQSAAEMAADVNDRFSVEDGGFVGSFGATAADVEQGLPASGDAAVEQGGDLYDRFSVEGAGFGVQRVDEDGDPVTTDRETDSLAGAAAVGVATPEPVTTAGGLAVLGGLAVGGIAYDTARRQGLFEDDGELEPAPPDTQQQELEIGEFGSAELEVSEQNTAELEVGGEVVSGSELEPSDSPTAGSELDIGGGAGETGDGQQGGETVVPDDYPLAGRDVPTDPTQESGRETQPEDILDDTFGTAPAGQQQTGQQRQQEEEDPLDELLEDFEETQQRRRRERARARERELGGAEEAISRRRQRQQRARRLPLVNSGEDTFGFGREFPTGASAVVGREIGRAESAQQSQVGQGDITDTDLFEDVTGRVDVGVSQQPAVLQEQQTGQRPQQGLFTVPDVAEETIPEQAFENPTLNQQQTETITPPETITENLFESGPGAGGLGNFERPPRPRTDNDNDNRDEEDYLLGEEGALFGSGISSGEELADDVFNVDEDDFF